MSIRPVDMKTALLTADNASKMREDQKTQEAGQAEQVSQNKHTQEQKIETVQHTEASEGQTIRKEDENNKKGNGRRQAAGGKGYKKPEEEKPKVRIEDGIHGLLDIKA